MAPPRNPTFYESIIEAMRWMRSQPFMSQINLGGGGGPDGGSGAPPGGFLGQLIQTKVAYDTTEAYTYSGGSSLVDNLAHMRAEMYERSWWGW